MDLSSTKFGPRLGIACALPSATKYRLPRLRLAFYGLCGLFRCLITATGALWVCNADLRGQSTFFWRTEAGGGNWQQSGNTQWWQAGGGATGFNYGVQWWDNNHFLTQTNNTASASTHAFHFNSGASSSHTFVGSSVRLYDINSGANDPYIRNASGVTHVFNFSLEGDGDSGDPLRLYLDSTGGLTFNGNITNNGSNINIEGSNTSSNKTVTFGGVVSGAGGIYLNNASVTALFDNANTQTGQLTINAGTARLGGPGDTFGAATLPVRVGAGASLNLSNQTATIQSIGEEGAGDGGSVDLGSGTLIVSGDSGGLYQGSITGTGGNLTKSGPGQLNLYGTQGYTGITTVSGGKLSTLVPMASSAFQITAGSSFETTQSGQISDSASVTLSGGTLEIGVTGSLGGGGLVLQPPASSISVLAGATATVVGQLSGSGALAKTGGGTLVFAAGGSSYSGNLSVGEGDVLVSANNALGTGAVVLTNGSLLLGDGVSLTNPVTLRTEFPGGPRTNNFTAYWNFGTLSGNSLPTAVTGSGVNFGAFSLSNNLGNLSTSLTNSSASSGYTDASGFFNVSAVTRNGALSATSTYFEVNILPSAGVDVSVNGLDFGTRSSATGPRLLSISASQDSHGVPLFTNALLNNSTWVRLSPRFAGFAPTNSPQTLRLYGSGGSNAIAGAVNWRIDDLVVYGTTVSNSPLVGGTSRLGIGQSGSGTFAGNIDLGHASNSAVLSAVAGGNVTFSGVISGPGTVTKSGSGTVVLSGANSYTGPLRIEAGTLSLASSAGASAGSAASVFVGSGSSLFLSASNQVNDSGGFLLDGGVVRLASGVTETVGSLSLARDSWVRFDAGTNGMMRFGSYTPAQRLNVNGFFTGNKLVFGSDLSTFLPATNRGPFISQHFYFDGSFQTAWDGSQFTVTAVPNSVGRAFLANWSPWSGGTEGDLFLGGGYLIVTEGPMLVGGKALFASPHSQTLPRTWTIRRDSPTGAVLHTISYTASEGWSITLDPGVYYFTPSGEDPYISPEFVDANFVPDFVVDVPLVDRASPLTPATPGAGVSVDVFNGVGGGSGVAGSGVPYPAALGTLSPSGRTLSPVVDFPNPGQVVNVGNNFDLFFANTTTPPVQVSGIQASNFTLKIEALLKIESALDVDLVRPGIQVVLRVASDDGYHLKIGDTTLGFAGDRPFLSSSHYVSFDQPGLYSLLLHFAANAVGESGLELSWTRGSPSVTEIIPQTHLYQSDAVVDQVITFEEIAAGSVPGDSYLARGVRFTTTAGLQATSEESEFVPISAPVVLGDPARPPSRPGEVSMQFTLPSTTTNAVSEFVSFYVIDAEGVGALVKAYDPAGGEVFSRTVAEGGRSQTLVEISHPHISRVEVKLGDATEKSAIDQLTFRTPRIPRPVLTLTLDEGPFSEGGNITGSVAIQNAWYEDLTVSFTGDPASRFGTLPQLVIPAGQTSAAFSLPVAADGVQSSPLNATLSATAAASLPATDTFTLLDIDWPDLVVTDLVFETQGSVVSSSDYTVRWKTKNNGNFAVSQSFSDRVIVRNLSTGQTHTNQLVAYNPAGAGNGPIGAGESRSRQFSGRLPDGPDGVGNLQIEVIADDDKTIAEYSPVLDAEANNSSQTTASSVLADYPDLQVTAVSVAPGAGLSGIQATGTAVFSWTVSNTGSGPAQGAFTDEVVVRNKTTGQTLFTRSLVYDPDAPGNAAIAPAGAVVRSTEFTLPLGISAVGQLEFAVTTNAGGSPIYEYNGDGTAGANNANATEVAATQEKQGPTVTNIKFNALDLTEGLVVTGSGSISLSASDLSGVGRVDFAVEAPGGGPEASLGSDTAAPYAASWNAETTQSDGIHTVVIRAYDTYGNATEVRRTLNLTLGVPPAPTITSPANNAVLSRSSATVTGTTQSGRQVTVSLNGSPDPATAPTDASGNYVKPLTLTDGTNLIEASVSNRAGSSEKASVTVTVDRSIPSAPTAVTAAAGAAGAIQLSWARPSGAIAGYHVYRSTTPGFEVAAGNRITSSLLAATSFRDTPPADGTYHYRIAAVNTAQTEGDPSVQVSAVSDRVAPTASVSYTPRGAHNAETGEFGNGPVDVSVTASEPLAATPFFSLSPPGASPVVVDLRRVSDTVYSGSFVITSSIPTGLAAASVSARDSAGNRGTAITSGEGIYIDTAGPKVVSLDIQPSRTVRNDPDDPVTVVFTVGLDSPVKDGTQPKFSYKLSQSLPTPVEIADVHPEADPLLYTVVQQLPANAGSTPESLQLLFEAVDALDNKGTVIDAQSSFQIYQNELPGLESPVGLTAQGKPAGEVLLGWNPVQGAARYRILRRAAGAGEFAQVAETEGATYTDLPSADGNYDYRVAAVREENEETSVGAPSNTATALSDRVPPAPPSNVRLSLVSRGVQVDWDHSPSFISEALTYSIYRTAPLPAEPQLAGAKIPGNRATDAAPSPDRPNYYLVAVDSVGNQSSATAWAYLNIDLLPVRTLEINQTDQAAPVVNWSQVSGNIGGYDIYWGPTNALTKLNTAGLLAATNTSFTDNSYTIGAGRNYTVVTVDNTGRESPGRSLELPRVSFSLPEGISVARGVMNRLTYTVRNDSTNTYENIQLRVKLAGREHYSELVDIEAGASGEVSVVVGGYSDLTSETAALETALLYAPGNGEKVFLVRNSTVAVTSGQLLVDLAPGEFTAGGKGKARFTVTNTSSEPIEFTTAEAGGSRDSSEARLSLLTADGSVLATKPLRISSGAQVVLLPNQRSVVRLAPGAVFTSPELEIDVPPNAPARMVLRLEIDKIYYRQGQPEQVVLDGLQTRRDILSVQTSYTAQVESVTPAESNGDVPVVIAGSATARVGGPMPNARLRLFIVRDGFESMREVFTDSAGRFSFDYVPAANEAGGVYEVRAVHPDITDRTAQKSFTIRRVTVSPMEANLRSVKNYVQPVSFTARTGRGVTVNGLRLEYLPQDQEGGVAVPGITVLPDAPVATVGSEQSATLGARITASLDAPASGVLYLRLSSNESGAAGWQKIKLNYQFGPAAALLTPSPRTINTGANPGSGVAEELTITNNGLIAAENLQFALLQQDGRVAPAWASLIAGDGGPLEVGASRTVSLSFQPDASVPPGQYGLVLRVQSTDGARTDVPISVVVTPAGEGNVEFRVVNPYTEYDTNGNVTVGLAGATIQIQNEDIASIERSVTTDNLGGALFENLPVGTYKYRVNANKHNPSSGRFWIRPGATTTQTVQMAYNPVTIEWSVVPITIEDRYDVVLDATYETDVPVPVIVMEPPSINIPRMCRGDVVRGEFTITNRGLIRADDFKIPLPPSDGRIRIELLAELPPSLDPNETVRIPYRVIALKDLGVDCSVGDDEGGGGSGGGGSDGDGSDRKGCWRVGTIKVPATFIYACSNGLVFPVHSYLYFFYTYWDEDCDDESGWDGNTSSPVSVFGPGGWDFGGDDGESGPFISGKPLPTVECWLIAIILGWHEITIDNLVPYYRTAVGCSVNTLTGQFEENIVDLDVPIPGNRGESVQVLRRYRNGEWRFFDKLGFIEAERSGPYSELYWQNFRFLPPAGGSEGGNARFFRSGNHVIEVDETRADARFRLSSSDNSFKVFDADGNLRSFGRNDRTHATMVYGANGEIAQVLAGGGPEVLLTYHWDNQGRLDRVEDYTDRVVDYTWEAIFNGAVDLHKVVSPDGSETLYSYEGFSRADEKGITRPASRITKITDSTSKSHFIAYSGDLVVKSVLDEKGRGSFFEFALDAAVGGIIGTVRSTSGRVDEKRFHDDGELYEWRVNGLLVRKVVRDLRTRTWVATDADGHEWIEVRDENGRTIKAINPDRTQRTFVYDPVSGRLVRATDERGVVTEMQYDVRGNPTAVAQAVNTPLQRAVQMDFGANDKLLQVQFPGDGVVEPSIVDITYDAVGDISRVTGPGGRTLEVLQRNALGSVTKSLDAGDNIWRTTYDERNRPVAVTDPRPGVKQTTFAFDSFNNMTEMTMPSGRSVKLEYDINNSLVSVVDPAGQTSTNAFDAGGRLAKSTDAMGREVSNQYDSFDRLVKTLDQEGNEIVFNYASDSASSRPVSIKFPTFTRTITYNFRGQPLTTTDTFASGVPLTTKYGYYPTGELETIEDSAGRVTRYQIDELGRVLEVSSPGPNNTLRTSRMSYDGAGNVRTFTNPNGRVWTYEYDVARQLTAEIAPHEKKRTEFDYNALGQLTAIRRPDGAVIERDFDEIGAVTEVREFAPGRVLAKTTTYSRDDDGRVVGYTESLPGATGGYSSADYEYDLAGRLKSETVRYTKTDGSFFASTVSYTYYANGLLQSYTAPSGTVTTYTYDQANRLIGTSVDGVGQFIVNGYDFGVMTGITLPGGLSKSFEYDGYQRPTKLISRDPAGQTISEIAVARDNTGNVVSRNTGQGASTFTYDPANRLIAGNSGSYTYDANGNRRTYSGTGSTMWQYDEDDRLTNDGTNSYEYDANGSLIRKTTPQGIWTFSYDHDGRLVQVVKPSGQTIEYRYDPAGRRIAKIIGGVATYYRYSLFGLCAEYAASGQLAREYGYAANAANGAAPLYLKEGGRSYFYHTDHLGTPWKLTSEAGGVVWSASYDDFGKANVASSLVENNWRFPGQYFDEETGLHYNHHRYYSPENGRYISRDPVSDGTNYYAYAEGNPINYTDSDGLRTVTYPSHSPDAPSIWDAFEAEGAFKWGDYVEIGYSTEDGFVASVYDKVFDGMFSFSYNSSHGFSANAELGLDEVSVTGSWSGGRESDFEFAYGPISYNPKDKHTIGIGPRVKIGNAELGGTVKTSMDVLLPAVYDELEQRVVESILGEDYRDPMTGSRSLRHGIPLAYDEYKGTHRSSIRRDTLPPGVRFYPRAYQHVLPAGFDAGAYLP
jgi:RHS repeat-associated protein